MTVVADNTSEELSSTTSTEWQDKVEASGEVGEGHYTIWISAEFSGSLAGKMVELRVLLDGGEVNLDQYYPPAGSASHSFSTMGRVFLLAGQHSVKVQYRTSDLASTALIRRARIVVQKD